MGDVEWWEPSGYRLGDRDGSLWGRGAWRALLTSGRTLTLTLSQRERGSEAWLL